MLSLAISWTVLIAVLCLVSFSDLPTVKIKSADKYVHVTLHFVFVLLWGFYVSKEKRGIPIPKIVLLVIASVLYGILIEFLQETLTTTRHADIYDVLANLTGAILALLVFVLIRKKRANHV